MSDSETKVVIDLPKKNKKLRKVKSHHRTSTPEDNQAVPKLGPLVIPPIKKKYKVYNADGSQVKQSKRKAKQLDWSSDINTGKPTKLSQKGLPEADHSSSLSEKSLTNRSWVTFGSPLWKKDTVHTSINPLPSLKYQRGQEDGFVNDAVKTFMFHYSRKRPIIPPYNAEKDKHARAYFQSPIAKAVLERSMQRALIIKAEEDNRKINKLSFRRRTKMSPTAEEIKAREDQFRNDAIITEKLRTKYKDIIPPYDASKDSNCMRYFGRPDVQRLVTITCGGRK